MATSVFDWNRPNCVKRQTNKSLKVTVRLAGKSSNQPWGKQLSLLSGSRTHTYPAILSLHSSQRYSGGGLSPKATDNEGSIHIWNKWQDRMTFPAPMHHVPNLWEAYHILTEAAFYYQGRRNCFSNPHTHTILCWGAHTGDVNVPARVPLSGYLQFKYQTLSRNLPSCHKAEKSPCSRAAQLCYMGDKHSNLSLGKGKCIIKISKSLTAIQMLAIETSQEI